MNSGTTGSRIQQIIDDCQTARTAREKLSILADGYFAVYQESGDIIRIVTEAAGTTPAAADFLRVANQRHQNALAQIVAGMRETGEIADGLSDDDTVKAIFYHFRYEKMALACEEFGWGRDLARDTILAWTVQAVLKDERAQSSPGA